MTRGGLALGIAALVVAGAGAAWYWFRAVEPPVTAVRAARAPVVEAVYATAVVEPVSWSRVSPTVTARIVQLKAREGDRVKAGDELGRLEDRAAQARIRELNARIEMLDADVKRLQPLVPKGFASRQSLDHALSELNQARAARTAARQELADLILRAPLDGVVLRRDGELGETVGPSQTVFWIGRPRPLRAEAEVDEEDIPRVRLGQRTLIKADAFPDRVLDGTVDEITPKGDPVSKSYRVYIALPDDTPLLIGMTVEANIVTRSEPSAVVVPPAALAESGGVLWAVADGRLRRTVVRLGVMGSDKVEVRAGLAAGDLVVINPTARLRDGARVRVRERPWP